MRWDEPSDAEAKEIGRAYLAKARQRGLTPQQTLAWLQTLMERSVAFSMRSLILDHLGVPHDDVIDSGL